MVLIRGVMSKFPCPICLVPCEQLSKMAVSGQYKQCTSSMVVQILRTAREQQRADEKEAILMDYGLQDVDVSKLLICLFAFH